MTEEGAPGLSLRVLGGFQLSRSGVPLEVPTRKLACLLAYLACTAPTPQPREKLANLFWGRHSEARARHNLRQALLRLRTLLGHAAITNSGDAVQLTPGVLDCDAARFGALLEAGGQAATALAADLYGGGLLEDVSFSDVAWNDWLLGERARLSERAVGAIVAQGEAALASGETEQAMRCGRRAIAIDSFREDGHRLLLRALAAAGRNSEALRHYQDLAVLLKAELDTEPDAETRRLVDTLGRRSDSAGPAAAPRAEALAPRQDPLRAGEPAVRLDGAERRPVTVLVCHAEVAAAPGARPDPEDVRDLILGFRRAAMEIVTGFGGLVIASPGHSVHACFGYPQARDQDAAQAARASLALVEATQALRAASDARLHAGLGLATGLVVVEAEGGAPFLIGEAPALALQLQALAGPGEIVASRDTRPLLEPGFELRPLEAAGRADGARPLEAWRVCAELDDAGGPDGARAGATPLVGRQEEFDLVLRRWEQARRGEGRVVLVSGEPGIGKSHLAGRLVAALDQDEPAHLRYFCSPHHALRPLHPYIRQVERSAQLASAGGPAEKLDRLAAVLRPASRHLARDVALLAELLGLPADARYPAREESPQQRRELLMAAYLEFLERLAAQRPVVVLFEDIHWIDPTSLDLLDRTVARIAQLPVLLIVTTRPEHQPAWAGQPHVSVLHLNRLGRRDSAAIVGEVSRERPLPAPIIDQIIDRADGVPLFVTELAKHLLESGLVGMSAGAQPRPPADMPTTLQAAFAVRLEGLGEAKGLALIGAALGRQFSRELIAAVVGREFPDLDGALQRLTASGLISRRGAPPNASFAFMHALGRDAAYEMLSRDQRRRLHGKIADVLIDRFSAQAEGSAEGVAHHLAQAGRTGEAADYWVRAARSARSRWANRESADFLDLALRALDGLPVTPATLRKAIDLRFEMKNALTPLGAFDRIIDCLQQARGLIERLDDPQRLCQFQVHMCQALGLSGKPEEAITFGQDAERLARTLGDPRLRVEATVFLATAHFSVMDHPQAERFFLETLRLLEDMPSGETFALAGSPAITARAYLTRIKAVRGEFEQGIAYGETAVRQAETLAQPYSLGLSIWCLADLHLSRGDVARAIDLLERGLAVSRQWDLPFLVAGHSGSLGYAYALIDRADEGLPLLEQAMGDFEKMRHQFALSLFRAPLGEAYVLGGRLDQAGDVARRALALARDTGQRAGEADSLRILASVAVRDGDLDEAEAQYRAALSLAEDLGLRPLAARCRHGLASVNAGRADRAKARTERAAATAMYRDMGMGFWLGQLEALEGG